MPTTEMRIMSPIGKVEGGVAAPEHEVAGQPVHPETAQEQEEPAEHEQHDGPADQNLTQAF